MIDSQRLKSIIAFSKTLNVMYVEDDRSAQEQIVKMLENFFQDITVCDDGVQALEKFETGMYDLVISDIYMPNMNGIELLENIRKIDEDVTFIIISGHNETNYLIDSINYSADGFLLKPIEITQFTNIMAKTAFRIKNYKDSMRIQEKQNKLATLGQMMDSIAHQWKQPLTTLNLSPMELDFKIQTGTEISNDDIKRCITDINSQVSHMIETIDDFRAFFRPDQPKENISIKETIESVVKLLKNILIKILEIIRQH